jgi:hypothetical protein
MFAECLLHSEHPRFVDAGLVLRERFNDRNRSQVLVVELDANRRCKPRGFLERAESVVQRWPLHVTIVASILTRKPQGARHAPDQPTRRLFCYRRVALSVHASIATLSAIHAAAHTHSGRRNNRAIVAASERPLSTRNSTRMSYTASSAT